MRKCTRRDFIRSGVASVVAPVAASAIPPAAFGQEVRDAPPPEAQAPGAKASPRERLLLDFDWLFRLGDACNAAKDFGFGVGDDGVFSKSGRLVTPGRIEEPEFRPKPDASGVPPMLVTPGHPGPPPALITQVENEFGGPPRVAFDATGWQQLNLPHDWAVDLPFVNQPHLMSRGYKPLGREFPETSIGWYRREFDIPASDRGRRISVEFDGVYRDAIVLFNGFYLGRNFSGYAPFRFDLTDFVRYGEKNVLVLRVDATLGDGWFYEGAGIYRHVWLVKTGQVYVPQWGTCVRSQPGARGAAARVSISTEVRNDSDADKACRVISHIVDAGGKVAGTATSAVEPVQAGASRQFEQQAAVANPALWSLEDPHLYRLETTIENEGAAIDHYETTFGIRSIRFDAEKGFFLNGKPVKIQGTCNHQDHAGVGTALPDRIQSYRVGRLKAMGSNAYRTSHNPPTPELLDDCDRLGMLVMDETRMMSSAPEGLSQLGRLIRRDRNHPSVVIWSLANEEPEQGTSTGALILASMKRLARGLDPSRPVTAAMDGGWGHGISAVVDVQGFNYHDRAIDGFHSRFPGKPTVGTETASTVSTRGIYRNNYQRGYVSAYDVNYPLWAATAETWWSIYARRPWVAGGFAWTGFDYRGEPTPYEWPCINSHFGIMDTCGFAKDNYFYYQAWWTTQPVLHLFPHWTWTGREGEEIDVWAHTNLDRVELLLNGRSLGASDVQGFSHVSWKVSYAPGTIEARAFKGGRQVLTVTHTTTGAPARIVLRPDRQHIAADGEDVSLITVEVQDDQGRAVPTASNEITFRVSGNGRLIGVGNGDPSSHESDHGSTRRLFNGLAMAIVQASKEPGDLVLGASSPGLESGSANIVCEAARLRPAVA
ncbi:MAG TPA: beta-galactosidase GalA [Terriglobia bacterium]|nr:beta-galactosidase GalA [Terriglobia bacterium]